MKNKIRFNKLLIEVECQRGDIDTQQIISNFYPVTPNRTRTIFRLSPRFAPEVLKEFRGINAHNIDEVPEAIQRIYWHEIIARAGISDLLANGPQKSPVINEYLTLDTHQELGREISQYRDRYAFFYDTRTGKTPMSLAIINDDIKENPTHKWLIVCPLILIENAWLEDANKFFPELVVINCHAATKAKRLAQLDKEGNIYITNTESFVKYSQYFEARHFHGCFVDESSSMKSNKSKVSKELVAYAQKVDRFYLLSGTPAPNGEWEYYMQLRAIDYYGMQPSFTQFKNRYFTNVSYNPQYEKLAIRPECKDELTALIRNYAVYVDKEDVLDTPGRTFHEIELVMPDTLTEYYNKMKNELYIEVSETEAQITAPSTAAKLNKLNQISSGFVVDTQAKKENKFYEQSKQEWYLLTDYRFKKLISMLDSFGDEQVIIWANYHIEFSIIQELLGDRCRCVYGKVSLDEKNEAIKLFKAGMIQYLIANPASADKGLTLTNAHIAVYFSLNWSYELFKQSIERIYGAKRSQPKHCEYYILIAKGTIDRVLYSTVLQGKRDASYAVLKHLKGGMAELADAGDLKSSDINRTGSNPVTPTNGGL